MSATTEQIQAIEARGEVLVSASAGAGKTTVMISRLANILEEGASLDEILAVTFTKKAAAQMKEKLRGELVKRLNCEDENKRENIRVQLGKINTADICTIDSFCARLIRTYFYMLKVDASFDVLSGGAEASVLRGRAMDELFDRLYAERNADLYTLLDTLRKKRSDASVKLALLSSYDELRQHADYMQILDDTEKVYTQEGFDKIKRQLSDELNHRLSVLVSAIDEFALSFAPAVNREGYMKVLTEMRDALLSLVADGTVFNPPTKLSSSSKPRVRPENAQADADFSAFVKELKKRYAAVIKDLQSEETERERLMRSGKIAVAYSRVLKAFCEVYDGVKRDEGKLDYADLEHLALKLLKTEEDVAAGIRQKYRYVFVDEYQDVNPIQDEIVNAVQGGDLFLVGDLKQAIYGFRGSRSEFFAEKSQTVLRSGKYLVLPDNFRSATAVISFVNKLFSKVMNEPVCQFNYADGHEMRGGARYAEGFDGVAEVCLFDKEQEEKSRAEEVYSVTDGKLNASRHTAEGLAVLKLVEEALKSSYYDPDEKKVKPVQTGDICVLTRKRDNANAQGIVRALSSKYPVVCEAETDICKRPEIVRMLDILSYLDNAEQDIPLTTALLSPLGGLDESELAKIRIYCGQNPLFRECCKKYAAEAHDGLAAKLNDFYERTERLRSVACSVGAARLIDEITCVGNFSADFNTAQKLAALRRLQREAYSAGGELYLGAFLAAIKAAGNKVLSPSALASDCIKVMTMHASKGLEFPVVIIADIAASFSGDNKNDIPFDEEFGFAPRCYSGKDRVFYSTPLRKLFKLKKEREELSNEINLFYVACTRAKYALHVLTSQASCGGILPLNFADNYADLFDVSAFTPRILAVEGQSASPARGDKRVLDVSRADGETYEKVRAAATYEYPYEMGVGLPVKSSASQLLSLLSGEEHTEKPFDDEIASDGETGVEAGIAYHRFLELCDFNIKDAAGISKEVELLRRSGSLTDAQAKLLKINELCGILNMDAFERTAGGELHREQEFVCRLPSCDYLSLKAGGEKFDVGGDDGNGVIVQGAIDLLIVKRQEGKVTGASIIDYKYSALPDGAIIEKYTPQLALYRSVVCKIYGLDESKVSTTIINIKLLRQIEMLAHK